MLAQVKKIGGTDDYQICYRDSVSVHMHIHVLITPSVGNHEGSTCVFNRMLPTFMPCFEHGVHFTRKPISTSA